MGVSIARRYNAWMLSRQSLPHLWLLSDERNDAGLEEALCRLPRRSGFIYRHYHLAEADRWKRFEHLRKLANQFQHRVILADSALTAREWGADGIYGAPRALYPQRRDLIQLATAHDMREIGLANRFGTDAVILSPVFRTRSHPAGKTLGPARFRMLATHAQMPVIALGGMNSSTAKRLQWPRWGAIDGLS